MAAVNFVIQASEPAPPGPDRVNPIKTEGGGGVSRIFANNLETLKVKNVHS